MMIVSIRKERGTRGSALLCTLQKGAKRLLLTPSHGLKMQIQGLHCHFTLSGAEDRAHPFLALCLWGRKSIRAVQSFSL